MAPGLEEEVVFQVMDETDDGVYLQDKVGALRELGFKIDSKKVKIAQERYKLLQAYNSQDNSKRAIRKRKKKTFKKVIADRIEIIKGNDPTVISCKPVLYCNCGLCPSCEDRMLEKVNIRTTHLVKSEKSYHKVTKSHQSNRFAYCQNCEEVF